MGPLESAKKNLKEGVIGLLLGSAAGSFISMVNLTEEVDEISVEAAVESTINTNKEDPKLVKDLNNFVKIYEIGERVSEKEEKQRFDTSKTFGTDLKQKDEDGYQKIEDKLKGIQAQVSEKQAIEDSEKKREKGGKARTRAGEE